MVANVIFSQNSVSIETIMAVTTGESLFLIGMLFDRGVHCKIIAPNARQTKPDEW